MKIKNVQNTFLIKSDSEYCVDHFLNNIHFGGIKHIFKKMCTTHKWVNFWKVLILFNHNVDQIWTLLVTQKLSLCSMPMMIPPKESESEVTQLCPTLCDSVDCSPPRSSVHGILQARILEWVAVETAAVISQKINSACF